jgi:hypothetical protein
MHMSDNEPSCARVRRSDAGLIRFTRRDAAGLCLVAEQYAAPYDLLGTALKVTPPRLRQVVARWRKAGYARSQVLATPGPAWCWLTPAGTAACGYPWPADPPALGRLAHLRAVLAARLWMTALPAWQRGHAEWRCERDLRPAAPGQPPGHLPDAEALWPSVDGSPYAGQAWAIEVELTPKSSARTAAIIAGLLDSPYAQVVYLASPAARPVVTRAAARFPAAQAARLAVHDLPAAARMPQATP